MNEAYHYTITPSHSSLFVIAQRVVHVTKMYPVTILQ